MEKYFKTDEARKYREQMHTALEIIPTRKDWKSVSSIYTDRELDRMIEVEELTNPAFTEVEAKRLFHELRERFGYSSLDASPTQVAMRVLKRKQIKDDEEYYMVKDLLNSVYPKASASLSKEQHDQLWQAYEGYSSK